jgi:hypothetical protein
MSMPATTRRTSVSATCVTMKPARRRCCVRSAAGAAAGSKRAIRVYAGEPQRGKERSGDASEDGDGDCRGEHSPVHVDVRAALQRFNQECAQQVEQAPCEQHSTDCAGGCEHHALREHLAEQPSTASTDGDAHSHLAFALDAASQ